MAWDGTLQIELIGKETVKLIFDGLDADNEETYTLSPVTIRDFGFTPHFATVICTDAQAGLTYDLALQGSADGTNWVDILTVTAKDTAGKTTINYAGAADPTPAGYEHFRILAADVTDGAATSHTFTAILYK